MDRLLYRNLVEWKQSRERKPLILQGIRQCGKTWLLKTFGEHEFEDTCYLNLETHTEYRCLFDTDFHPHRIISEIGILRNRTVIPGHTLLILDEIQACPRALTALKYFAEEMPELHVCSAGSLLGVHLSQRETSVSFPVGKVQTYTLYPLSFREFLMANGEFILCQYLEQTLFPSHLYFTKLERYYKQYLITGGMPAVVHAWISDHRIETVNEILSNLVSDYEKDFVKYAPSSDFPKLMLIWKGIPGQLARENQKFMFSHLKTGMRARDLEDALYWLIAAGLIYKVEKTVHPYLPLSAYTDTSFYKIYMADIGLLRTLAAVSSDIMLRTDENTAYIRGMMAENFVLTEILANHLTDTNSGQFWRSANSAEIDFLIQTGGEVVPIEVKAGRNLRSRSLTEYCRNYHPHIAVRTGIQPVSHHDEILEIPLYLFWTLSLYLKNINSADLTKYNK